jgi:hypothetical protein
VLLALAVDAAIICSRMSIKRTVSIRRRTFFFTQPVSHNRPSLPLNLYYRSFLAASQQTYRPSAPPSIITYIRLTLPINPYLLYSSYTNDGDGDETARFSFVSPFTVQQEAIFFFTERGTVRREKRASAPYYIWLSRSLVRRRLWGPGDPSSLHYMYMVDIFQNLLPNTESSGLLSI